MISEGNRDQVIPVLAGSASENVEVSVVMIESVTPPLQILSFQLDGLPFELVDVSCGQ